MVALLLPCRRLMADGCLPAPGLRWQLPHHAAEQIGRHFAEVTATALSYGLQVPQGGRIKLQIKALGELGGIELVAIRIALIRLGRPGVGLHCEWNPWTYNKIRSLPGGSALAVSKWAAMALPRCWPCPCTSATILPIFQG